MKIKEKSLDFLGFPSPIWAFSMGYGDPPRQKDFFLLLTYRSPPGLLPR
jgi:hypothetical protein